MLALAEFLMSGSMDVILHKISDIESQLSSLKELVKYEARSTNCRRGEKGQSVNPACQDWIEALSARHGEWKGKPLVVLSLFDGIGGVWVALSLLGIPYKGYSAEVNQDSIQVVKAKHPAVQHLGDVRGIRKEHIREKVDLVVGGFPCQDLSWIGKKIGLHGERSKLFFELLRMLKLFQPKWFLVENVASMHWVDRDEISKHIGCLPIEIDSRELSANKRKRYYWTNIPYPLLMPNVANDPSTCLQQVLKNATALEEKLGCVLGQNPLGSHVQLQQVLKTDGISVRNVSVDEVEQALGFPAGYTDIHFSDERLGQVGLATPDSQESSERARAMGRSKIIDKVTNINMQISKRKAKIRWHLLGNSFSVRVIAYLLSPLLDKSALQTTRPLALPDKTSTDECAAMEVGEVWALYNMQQLPNWYAVIQNRSGDRFSPLQHGSKKSPLHIEVKFLEMDSQYSSGEVDKWNPRRGAGLYHLGTTGETQDCWLSFSHRVTGFVKTQHGYFFYPHKGEVWAMYQRGERSRPWFVFVVDSKIDKGKLEQRKPGQEGFKARCKILLLTVITDVFRITDKEMVYTDLLQFAFAVPYLFKNEANLIKLEFSNKGRKMLSERKRKRGRKGRGGNVEDSDELLSVDDELEIDNGDDEEG